MRKKSYLVEARYTPGKWFALEVYDDKTAAEEFAQHVRDTWTATKATGDAYVRVGWIPLTLSEDTS